MSTVLHPMNCHYTCGESCSPSTVSIHITFCAGPGSQPTPKGLRRQTRPTKDREKRVSPEEGKPKFAEIHRIIEEKGNPTL